MSRSVRRQTLSVALFPFLAVLICTLGALIMLLVLFVQQARVDAKNIAAEQRPDEAAAAEQKRQREEFEDAQWRRELLEQQRTEKTQELAESRAKLAHLEEHIDRLEARAKELLERAKEIDEGKKLQDHELAAAQAELARLQNDISRKKVELDEARRKQRGQEQWFALIPYDGPNGTRRRPIYIECTDQGIVLQPEGIVFRPDDFSGPLTAGNPLDSALRTIREYLNQAGGKLGDPYPLLVVRPSGIVAYGAARSALKNWDDEFGYELISADKQLAFGEPDPALAAQLQRSVAVARQRQAALLAMTPRRFKDDEPLTSFDPGSLPGISPEAFSPAGSGIGGSGASRTGVGNGSGQGGNPGGSGMSLGGQGNSPLGRASSGSLAGTGAGGDSTGAGSFSGSTNGGSVGPYSSQPGVAGTGQPGGGQPGSSGGGVAGGNGPSSMGGSTTQQPGQMQLPGGTFGNSAQPRPAGSTGGSGGESAGGQSGSGGGSPQYSAGSTTTSSSNQSGAAQSGKSRGTNWGLPNAAGRSTGITRPIYVAVLADRVVLVPERGLDRAAQQIAVSPQLQATEVDAFVSAVQKEMKSWGLAVAGGYWKPVLQMDVAPDAEQRFAELQSALQGSGYEIVRK